MVCCTGSALTATCRSEKAHSRAVAGTGSSGRPLRRMYRASRSLTASSSALSSAQRRSHTPCHSAHGLQLSIGCDRRKTDCSISGLFLHWLMSCYPVHLFGICFASLLMSIFMP